PAPTPSPFRRQPPPPSPHPFPTRRSSDLHAPLHLHERGVGGLDRLRGGGLGWRTRLDRHPRAERHPQPSQPASGRGRRFSGTHGDRKSTRLNSSHRTISYAVFCLKKKNDE